MQQYVSCALPPWRLVFLQGRGCERSELPCPGFGGGELGRRSWPFFPKHSLDDGHGALCLQIFISNRLMGRWSWCVAPATACTLHTTALAVGPFRGRGCERSELPCLSFGGVELGRRSWSFLHLNHRFLRESLFSINTHDHHIALVACVPHASKTIDNSSGSPFIHSNIHHKRKKDQDLRPRCLCHWPGRVARFARNHAL